MPIYSSSYRKFCQSLEEICLLQRQAKKLSRKVGAKHYDLSLTLCRSGVMLLSAHLEAYFEDVVTEILQQAHVRGVPKNSFGKAFLVGLSADLLDNIFSTENPEKRAKHIENLFMRDGDVWSADKVFKAPVNYEKIITPFSNPKFKNIQQLLGTIGFRDFKGQLYARLKAQADIHVQMIDSIVHKRNLIAHGDKAAVSITHLDLDQMITHTKTFCNKSDITICVWAKSIGCSIR